MARNITATMWVEWIKSSNKLTLHPTTTNMCMYVLIIPKSFIYFNKQAGLGVSKDFDKKWWDEMIRKDKRSSFTFSNLDFGEH